MRFFLREEVEARPAGRAGRAVFDRFLFGGEFDGVIGGREGAGGEQLLVRALGRRPPRFFPFFVRLFDRAFRRFFAGVSADRLLLSDQVRFPVVEEELGGRADLIDRSLGVGYVGEVDRDLVGAQTRDFGLGDAELVDPLADDLDRVIDVFAADFFRLAGRRALVDELDAALEVKAELGRLAGDDQRRDADQAKDKEQDEEVFAPFAHPVLNSPG